MRALCWHGKGDVRVDVRSQRSASARCRNQDYRLRYLWIRSPSPRRLSADHGESGDILGRETWAGD